MPEEKLSFDDQQLPELQQLRQLKLQAHLLVYQQFGRVQPHGKEWQMVMQDLFQLPADTCHQFDTHSVRGQTFAYRCDCQTHQLSIRRYQNILRKSAVYHCRVCKKALLEVL